MTEGVYYNQNIQQLTEESSRMYGNQLSDLEVLLSNFFNSRSKIDAVRVVVIYFINQFNSRYFEVAGHSFLNEYRRTLNNLRRKLNNDHSYFKILIRTTNLIIMNSCKVYLRAYDLISDVSILSPLCSQYPDAEMPLHELLMSVFNMQEDSEIVYHIFRKLQFRKMTKNIVDFL